MWSSCICGQHCFLVARKKNNGVKRTCEINHHEFVCLLVSLFLPSRNWRMIGPIVLILAQKDSINIHDYSVSRSCTAGVPNDLAAGRYRTVDHLVPDRTEKLRTFYFLPPPPPPPPILLTIAVCRCFILKKMTTSICASFLHLFRS